MKKETEDTIYSLIMTGLISGVVFQLIYLKTHTFDFTFTKFLFVFMLYEAISIKKTFKRVQQDLLNYSTYLKLYLDVKLGTVNADELKEYFQKLVEEAEKK